MKYTNMSAEMQRKVSAIYDDGWRADDRDDLKAEYELTDNEVDEICEGLESLENDDTDEATKKYSVNREYWADWGVWDDPVVDFAEIKRLAAEWGKPVSELMEQVDEIYEGHESLEEEA